MKKLISILTVVMCGVVVMAGCSGKGASASTKMKDGNTVQTVIDKIVEDVGIAMPAPLDDTILQDMYYVDPADVEAYAGQLSTVMISADNIVAVHAKDGKIDTVKAALEKRLGDVRSSFEQYLPEQSVKAQKGQVIVKGNYAFLLILGESEETYDSDMEKAVAIIDAAF